MLLTAILADSELRSSALAIGVLAALIGYGAVSETYMPAPILAVAADLQTTYDSVYKAIRKRLAPLGYVRLSTLAEGRQRLLMRVVWPSTKPARRKRG